MNNYIFWLGATAWIQFWSIQKLYWSEVCSPWYCWHRNVSCGEYCGRFSHGGLQWIGWHWNRYLYIELVSGDDRKVCSTPYTYCLPHNINWTNAFFGNKFLPILHKLHWFFLYEDICFYNVFGTLQSPPIKWLFATAH